MSTSTEEQSDDTDAASPPRPPARRRRRLLGGERPFVLVFLAALGLAVLLVSGPARTWMTQRDLVDGREAVLEALEAENTRLDARVDDLNDPDTIEAEAREEQGMYPPGEVPYVIVPPAVDQPQLRPDVPEEPGEEPGIVERIRQAIADIFG